MHRFTVTISITINGIALQLLVQVHGLLQCDDGKEGGTEHGGVPGMAVAVPKLRAVHILLGACAVSGNDDALLLLGLVKNLFFSLLNIAIYLMPVFGGRMSFVNWVQEWRVSNTYYRQGTMDTMKRRTSLGSS
jgi:hypothetical protein